MEISIAAGPYAILFIRVLPLYQIFALMLTGGGDLYGRIYREYTLAAFYTIMLYFRQHSHDISHNKEGTCFPGKAGLIIMATGFLAAAIHEIPIKIAFPFVIDILLETLSVLRLFGPLIYFGGLIKKIDDPVAKRTGKVAYITLCSGVCLLFLIFIIIAHFKK